VSKFTRAHIRAILQAAGLNICHARKLTDRIIGDMAAVIAAGETVELRGLGSFTTKARKARRAHNPRTLAPVDVPARRVVFFRPCRKLKAAMNAPEVFSPEAAIDNL
jgi:integration host factor subunit beta